MYILSLPREHSFIISMHELPNSHPSMLIRVAAEQLINEFVTIETPAKQSSRTRKQPKTPRKKRSEPHDAIVATVMEVH
jgi:hypothetical protein